MYFSLSNCSCKQLLLLQLWAWVTCCSVTQSCPPLYDPMDCSMLDFPLLHHLLELAQTYVHWVSDIIQPFHPLSSPSLRAFNISQHQSLYQWVISTHQVLLASASASVLSVNIQGWFPVELNGLISVQSKGLSRVFSNTTVQKHWLFGAQLFSQSNSHIHTWPLEKP